MYVAALAHAIGVVTVVVPVTLTLVPTLMDHTPGRVPIPRARSLLNHDPLAIERPGLDPVVHPATSVARIPVTIDQIHDPPLVDGVRIDIQVDWRVVRLDQHWLGAGVRVTAAKPERGDHERKPKTSSHAVDVGHTSRRASDMPTDAAV